MKWQKRQEERKRKIMSENACSSLFVMKSSKTGKRETGNTLLSPMTPTWWPNWWMLFGFLGILWICATFYKYQVLRSKCSVTQPTWLVCVKKQTLFSIFKAKGKILKYVSLTFFFSLHYFFPHWTQIKRNQVFLQRNSAWNSQKNMSFIYQVNLCMPYILRVIHTKSDNYKDK